MYSIGNELSEAATQKGIELSKKIVENIHKKDNTRPVTAGANLMIIALSSMRRGIYDDVKTKTESGDASKKTKKSRLRFWKLLTSQATTTLQEDTKKMESVIPRESFMAARLFLSLSLKTGNR